MATGFILLIWVCSLVVSFTGEIEAQTWQSPCPRLFVYDPSKNTVDTWHGIITLLTTSTLSGVWLRVRFDGPVIQVGNYFGEVAYKGDNEYRIKNREFMLLAHTPKVIEIYVKYNPNEPAPRLSGLRLNGITICPEEEVKAPEVMEYTNAPIGLTTTFAPRAMSASAPAPAPVPPPSVVHSVLRVRRCGRPSVATATPLILHGFNSTTGDWPWHVAIYRNYGGTLTYICGGSIISKHYILTAAHCVVDLATGYALTPSNFLIHAGTANLKDFPSSTQTVRIHRIHCHPDFSRSNYHNDIALLQLAPPLEYNNYVMSVCLWQGSTELGRVVNETGTLVGFGADETGSLSKILKRTELPIIDTAKCIYSKPDYYAKFMSFNSFCAGLRDGTGPCNGDSGSGLVLKRPDADGGQSWYLRGMVSLSIQSEDKQKCNPHDYIVFTDAAKFASWIKKITAENP